MMDKLIINCVYGFCLFIWAERREMLCIADIFPNWAGRGIRAKLSYDADYYGD